MRSKMEIIAYLLPHSMFQRALSGWFVQWDQRWNGNGAGCVCKIRRSWWGWQHPVLRCGPRTQWLRGSPVTENNETHEDRCTAPVGTKVRRQETWGSTKNQNEDKEENIPCQGKWKCQWVGIHPQARVHHSCFYIYFLQLCCLNGITFVENMGCLPQRKPAATVTLPNLQCILGVLVFP